MIVVMGWKKSTIEESLSKYVLEEKNWYHEGKIKISCGGKTGIFDRDEK